MQNFVNVHAVLLNLDGYGDGDLQLYRINISFFFYMYIFISNYDPRRARARASMSLILISHILNALSLIALHRPRPFFAMNIKDVDKRFRGDDSAKRLRITPARRISPHISRDENAPRCVHMRGT